MNKLRVIGLAGYMRSGKTTVANTLALGGYTEISLASGLRSAIRDLDGPNWEFGKESTLPIRQQMQLMGTECRVDVGSVDLWVKLALTKIRYASTYHNVPKYKFVIPDIRYQHEIDIITEWVKSWEGTYETWLIKRPNVDFSFNAIGIASSHSSEQHAHELKPISNIILNSGTKLDLINGVINLESIDEQTRIKDGR